MRIYNDDDYDFGIVTRVPEVRSILSKFNFIPAKMLMSEEARNCARNFAIQFDVSEPSVGP